MRTASPGKSKVEGGRQLPRRGVPIRNDQWEQIKHAPRKRTIISRNLATRRPIFKTVRLCYTLIVI